MTRPLGSIERGLLAASAARELGAVLLRKRLARGDRAVADRQAEFYDRIWSDAAEAVGAPVERRGDGALAIDLGATRITVRGTSCSIDDAAALDRAGDKPGVYAILAAEGISVPDHAVFSLAGVERALDFLASSGGPCVVKPARDTAGGRGVAAGLDCRADILRAASAAAAHGARADRVGRPRGRAARVGHVIRRLRSVPLLIEPMVAGDDHRVLLLDGRCIDVVRRGAPSLTGDGVATLRELVERGNAARLRDDPSRAQILLRTDVELERTLAAQGLTLSSVPESGRRVIVKRVVNENAADDNVSVLDRACPELVDECARAARAVGARLAGVDVITTDPGRPLGETGGRILEVNTTPGLRIHYQGTGAGVDPARAILEQLRAAHAVPGSS